MRSIEEMRSELMRAQTGSRLNFLLSQAARRDLPPEKWTPGYAYFASACCGVM
jgi:hypothetical protein